MPGEGSMLHMIITLRNNRNLRRSRRRRFLNRENETGPNNVRLFHRQDISSDQLQMVKQEIRMRTKKERRKTLTITTIVFTILGFFLIYLWFYIL